LIPENEVGVLGELAREKKAWIAAYGDFQDRAAWHQRAMEFNESIRKLLPMDYQTLAHEQHQAHLDQRQDAITSSREYSIAIFPSEYVIDQLHRLAAAELVK
jgi:hypothetical protein